MHPRTPSCWKMWISTSFPWLTRMATSSPGRMIACGERLGVWIRAPVAWDVTLIEISALCGVRKDYNIRRKFKNGYVFCYWQAVNPRHPIHARIFIMGPGPFLSRKHGPLRSLWMTRKQRALNFWLIWPFILMLTYVSIGPCNVNIERGIQILSFCVFLNSVFLCFFKMWLLPWGYTSGVYPPDYSDQLSLGQSAIAALQGVHGTRYTTGQGADLLCTAAINFVS